MTLTATLPAGQLAQFDKLLGNRFASARTEVQAAMALAFYEIVMGNIGGSFGVDRPSEWPPLTQAYAKRVNRSFATLEVTGALRNAVKINTDNPFQSTVSISNDDVPYALVHQFGGGNNIPARPYFPIEPGGSAEAGVDFGPTPFAREWVLDAAREELRRALA